MTIAVADLIHGIAVHYPDGVCYYAHPVSKGWACTATVLRNPNIARKVLIGDEVYPTAEEAVEEMRKLVELLVSVYNDADQVMLDLMKNRVNRIT